jgi:uncharacterized protein
MSYLLDVNVLIALAWPRHVHHLPATAWFATAHDRGWATTPVTEAGFVRVSSNPRVFPNGVTPGQAAGLLAAMREVAGHEFWADTTSLADTVEEVSAHVHGSSAVTDAHLALLCARSRGTLVTFDRGVAKLAREFGVDTFVITP